MPSGRAAGRGEGIPPGVQESIGSAYQSRPPGIKGKRSPISRRCSACPPVFLSFRESQDLIDRLVTTPLVASSMSCINVVSVQRVTTLGHGHQLIHLEAPRMTSWQGVVDVPSSSKRAAYPTGAALRLQPVSELGSSVAILAARVALLAAHD